MQQPAAAATALATTAAASVTVAAAAPTGAVATAATASNGSSDGASSCDVHRNNNSSGGDSGDRSNPQAESEVTAAAQQSEHPEQPKQPKQIKKAAPVQTPMVLRKRKAGSSPSQLPGYTPSKSKPPRSPANPRQQQLPLQHVPEPCASAAQPDYGPEAAQCSTRPGAPTQGAHNFSTTGMSSSPPPDQSDCYTTSALVVLAETSTPSDPPSIALAAISSTSHEAEQRARDLRELQAIRKQTFQRLQQLKAQRPPATAPVAERRAFDALYAQEFDAAKDVLYHGRAGDLLYSVHQLPKPSHKELQQALSQRGLPTHGNNRKLRAALTKALSQEACTPVLRPAEPPSATPADHDHDQEDSDDCSDVACGSHANDWDFDSDHDADAAYNYGDDSRLDAFC